MTVKLSDLVQRYEDKTSGDFGEWCDKLELIAKLQKVEDLVSFLPLFLSGPAFAVYKQLDDSTKGNYTKLKEELLQAFSDNSFSAYEQLRTRTLVDGETVDVYLADLRRLVALIGQTEPEPLLKCAFVAGLPDEITTQLKSVASVEKLSLTDLVSRARMMMSSRATDAGSCAIGYTKKDSTCYGCSKVGHTYRQGGASNRNNARRQVQCYRCQQFGHISRHCKQEQGNDKGGVSLLDAPPALK